MIVLKTSVSHHGFRRYLYLSVDVESSELMHLPVEQLHSCAETLATKFNEGGETSYIDEAIVLDCDALELRPPGHPKHSVSLTLLAIHLINRYDQLRAMRGLDEATLINQEALDLCPQGHPDRAMSLNNLASKENGGPNSLEERQ